MAKTHEVKVPDIGGAAGVDVIEILVKAGDSIKIDTPLITLESDKASMEIPSPSGGVIKSLAIKVGDKVSEGDVILVMESEESALESDSQSPPVNEESTTPKSEAKEEIQSKDVPAPISIDKQPAPSPQQTSSTPTGSTENQELVLAGPGVRRLAREFGIDLAKIQGSGRKARVSKEDVQNYVKTSLQKSVGGAFSLPAQPDIDFSRFGQVEIKPLNKIKRLTGENVHRAWITIPHVTQFDEADITNLEAFRKSEAGKDNSGVKLTLLAFVSKVIAKALIKFPQFNASLDSSGTNLIYKNYYNIGIAVETPNGLVVPVIKAVDKLSVLEIAQEMACLSQKARDKGLMPADMAGGCFTISSLGGIGGTAFTPIVNSPEVAILGLSRSSMKPVYENNQFVARLMLPLSLSYDHRVIDGAEAARFTRFVSESLSDIRRILL
jgi:pyruvate dehydrogenase E2 component (dihydrolipoamide acetyltransferase)